MSRDDPGLAAARTPPPVRDDAAILEFDLVDGSGRAARGADPAKKVEQAVLRYEAGDLPGAIALLDQALAADPEYLRAWQWKAKCLIRLGNTERAIAELTQARTQVVGAAAVAKVDEMLDACRRALTDRPVKRARRALRAGQPAQAVAILDECAPTLAGDADFGARLIYARERARDNATTELSHAVLQGVLAWLSAEELAAGTDAYAAGEYRTAANQFAAARKRDSRHTVAALYEAQAVLSMAVALMNDPPDKWAEQVDRARRVAQLFRQADTLAQQAERNPVIAGTAVALRQAVADRARTNDERGRRAAKIVAYQKCADDFVGLHRYYEKNSRDVLASVSFITSFPQIESRAHRLRDKYGTDDPDIGEALADLVAAVARTRKNIRW